MRAIAITLVLLAAGCSGAPEGNMSAGGDTNGTASTAASQVHPSDSAPSTTSETAAAGTLPPADTHYRYVGRWAATRQLCVTGAWRFEPKRLVTAGEVSCTFASVDTVPGGYDLHAICTAEAPPEPDIITLRFAESAQAMLVESQTLKPVGLIYCGPLK